MSVSLTRLLTLHTKLLTLLVSVSPTKLLTLLVPLHLLLLVPLHLNQIVPVLVQVQLPAHLQLPLLTVLMLDRLLPTLYQPESSQTRGKLHSAIAL